MPLSLGQMGAFLLALVMIFVVGRTLVCSGGDGEGRPGPPSFQAKRGALASAAAGGKRAPGLGSV